jgi:hypothetical protein
MVVGQGVDEAWRGLGVLRSRDDVRIVSKLNIKRKKLVCVGHHFVRHVPRPLFLLFLFIAFPQNSFD